jgi:hypothetical protein
VDTPIQDALAPTAVGSAYTHRGCSETFTFIAGEQSCLNIALTLDRLRVIRNYVMSRDPGELPIQCIFGSYAVEPHACHSA